MERHSIERGPEIELREVPSDDQKVRQQCASLITKLSWGENYPKNPMDEVGAAEYVLGAYSGEELIGCVTVTRNSSPDGEGNGELWLGDCVVEEDFQKRLVGDKLYERALSYMQNRPGRIFSCTDIPYVDSFLQGSGWHKIRDTKDAQGADSRVYEFDRK